MLVGIFFIIRRMLLNADETWSTFLGGCTLSFGPATGTPRPGPHGRADLLLAISYFTTVPSLYANFGSTNATPSFCLKSVLLLLVIGMTVDNVWLFGRATRHWQGAEVLSLQELWVHRDLSAIWHILSVIAAVKEGRQPGVCTHVAEVKDIDPVCVII